MFHWLSGILVLGDLQQRDKHEVLPSATVKHTGISTASSCECTRTKHYLRSQTSQVTFKQVANHHLEKLFWYQ